MAERAAEPAAKRTAFGFVVAAIVTLLSLPTLIVVGTSFTAGDMIAFPPEGLSLKWYHALTERPEIVSAFVRSIYVAAMATAIMVPVGTLTAIALTAFRRRTRTALEVYFLLPFTIPVVVSGIAMMTLLGELRLLGALWPVALAIAAVNVPFMIGTVGASLSNLDPDLQDAATNCGAAPVVVFFTVTLPAVTPGIITGSLLTFILAFNEFVVSIFLVDKRIETLPVALFTSIRSIVTPDIAAVSVVYIVLAGAGILIIDRLVGLELFLRSR